ncbi:MAG: hypothetical protein IJ747_05190 [Lachnospiraceae bacterium]|nr:hypothetical protein [Lachnospiraceae bacterium]
MVELFEQNRKFKTRQSSKGNQLKWENNGTWYKADYAGYEGLSEYMVSHLLQTSSLLEEEFVCYELEQISYKTQIFRGAKSADFLSGDWQIITLERLFEGFFGKGLNYAIYKIADEKERLRFLVEQTERITGLKNFGIYMNKLFTIDAFFLNEDRHTHNIAVLMDGAHRFRLCPFFDHGASLLSDTTLDYPLEGELYELIDSAKAKTISKDFETQMEVSEDLYGQNLQFHFSKKDVEQLLEQADIYPDAIHERVRRILFEQMRRYPYLFPRAMS